MRNLILTLIMLVCAACSGESGPELRNDPALLGPEQTVAALGIAFRAPLAFQAALPGYVERSQQALRNSPQAEDPWFVLPHFVYGIPNADARCFLSGFPNQRGAAFDEAWRARYLEASREKAGSAKVEARVYGAGENAVHSYLIRNDGLVNQRFLVQGSGGQVVQVDFLLPAADWETLVPAIESAVASIRVL